jgi:hypothetical protein
MAKETESIPISEIFLDDGFERNYKLLMREENNNEMIDLITGELISTANQRTVFKKTNKLASSKGGQTTAQQKKIELEDRNSRIKKQSIKLLTQGKEQRSIAGILAKQHNLSPRQIRNILKN